MKIVGRVLGAFILGMVAALVVSATSVLATGGATDIVNDTSFGGVLWVPLAILIYRWFARRDANKGEHAPTVRPDASAADKVARVDPQDPRHMDSLFRRWEDPDVRRALLNRATRMRNSR